MRYLPCFAGFLTFLSVAQSINAPAATHRIIKPDLILENSAGLMGSAMTVFSQF
jgi:hypothetical protein